MTKSSLTRAFAVAIAALAAANAKADVIDQYQGNWDAVQLQLNRTIQTQSFVTAVNNISGAGFRILNGNNPGDLSAALWDKPPQLSDAKILAQGMARVNARTNWWVDVFWNPVEIEVGGLYYLTIGGNVDDMYALHSTQNPYAAGRASTGSLSDDLAFRTFTETGAFANAAASVPESNSTLTAATTALAAAALLAKARRPTQS
ncbi:hypothetical protein F183_A15840 [Bryobacterales bacterium F-183]|nr:hypothetical protein F183_A15840 [Bryobacterales bacterium F-183]